MNSSLPISSGDDVIPRRVGTRLIASLRPGHRFVRLKDVGNGKTMKTKGVLPARYHCKGGGGVERGGDPCGRPPGRNFVVLKLLAKSLLPTPPLPPTLNHPPPCCYFLSS